MRIRYLSVAAALLVAGACGDSTEPRVPTAVEVDQQNVSLETGGTAHVTARVVDQHGRAFDTPPEGFAITWSSGDPATASVTDGAITGVWHGTTVVTASAGGLPSAEVNVNVGVRTITTQMGFSFSGDRTGSFSVQETFPGNAIDWGGNWAFTVHNTEYGDQDVMAQRRRGDGLVDFIWFWIEGQVTSTGTRQPYGGFMLFGYDSATETWENEYGVTSGSVTFNSVTSTQLAGTFTLNLEEEDTNAPLSVTGGTFDLALVPEQVVFGDPATASFDGAGAVEVPAAVRLRARR